MNRKIKSFWRLKEKSNSEPKHYLKSTCHVQVRRMEKCVSLAGLEVSFYKKDRKMILKELLKVIILSWLKA